MCYKDLTISANCRQSHQSAAAGDRLGIHLADLWSHSTRRRTVSDSARFPSSRSSQHQQWTGGGGFIVLSCYWALLVFVIAELSMLSGPLRRSWMTKIPTWPSMLLRWGVCSGNCWELLCSFVGCDSLHFEESCRAEMCVCVVCVLSGYDTLSFRSWSRWWRTVARLSTMRWRVSKPWRNWRIYSRSPLLCLFLYYIAYV